MVTGQIAARFVVPALSALCGLGVSDLLGGHRESDPVVQTAAVVSEAVQGVPILTEGSKGIRCLRTLRAVAEQDVDAAPIELVLPSEDLVVRDVDGSRKGQPAAGVWDARVHKLSATQHKLSHLKFSDGAYSRDGLHGLNLSPRRLDGDHVGFVYRPGHVLGIARAGSADTS